LRKENSRAEGLRRPEVEWEIGKGREKTGDGVKEKNSCGGKLNYLYCGNAFFHKGTLSEPHETTLKKIGIARTGEGKKQPRSLVRSN